MALWRKIKIYIPLIGIILFVYLLIKLNVVEVIKNVREADKFYLLLSIIFIFIYLIFQTLKWYILAKKQKINLPFGEAFKINLFGNFYGLITPAKAGGVIRAGYLKKYSKNIGKGLGNFVIDKVLDLSSLFFLAIVLGLIVLREKLNIMVITYLILLFFIMLVLFFVFYNKKRSGFLLSIIYRKFVPKKMQKKAKTTFNSFYKDMPRKRFLFIVFIVNLVAWIVNYMIAYFIGLSVGININFIYFLAIYPIATLVAQIPVTIGGLGTREFTLISLFSLYRIDAIKVFSMSVIGIFIAEIFPALIAILLIFKENKV